MDKSRIDANEPMRRLDEDFLAALNMIGEGSPEYMADLEDAAPEKRKGKEKFRLDPIELALRMDEDFLAVMNMIGEGSPEYMADLEEKILRMRARKEAGKKDFH